MIVLGRLSLVIIFVVLAITLINSFLVSDIVLGIAQTLPQLVLLLNIFLILLIPIFLLPSLSNLAKEISDEGQFLAFIFASTSALGSLFYSQIMQYIPCELCWFQRIFMYPLSILLFVSILKKDYKIFEYVLPLCILGSFFSVYHYSVQFFGVSSVCDISGPSSCSDRAVEAFGYITLPFMALSGFISVAILTYFKEKRFK